MIRYTPVNTNVIPANADLDSYTNPGTYYCSSTSDVGTITNCPVTTAFRVDVMDFKIRAQNGRYNYGYQEVTAYTAPWKIYRRWIRTGSTAGVWTFGDWYLIEGTSTVSG